MFLRIHISFLAPLLLRCVARNGNDRSPASLQPENFDGRVRVRAKHVSRDEIEYWLIVCNAYASPAGLEVYHVQLLESLTGSYPLNYKDCREFFVDLAEDDQLDFRVGNLDVGTFYATGVPKASTRLLLVPHRRNSNSVAINFESHAFVDSPYPQIAVVDAYGGRNDVVVRISDAVPASMLGVDGTPAPAETLQFNSVIAVHAGNYEVSLADNGANNFSEVAPLLAKDREQYVVMRVGNEANSTVGSPAYPQELVIFPRSCAINTHSFCLAFFSLVVLATGVLY